MGQLASKSYNWLKAVPRGYYGYLIVVGIVYLAVFLVPPLISNSRANQICAHDGGFEMRTGSGLVICRDYKPFDYQTGKPYDYQTRSVIENGAGK